MQNADLKTKGRPNDDGDVKIGGKINGTFVITALDSVTSEPKGDLIGEYKGRLKGTLNLITFATSGSDKAKWKLTGSTGIFAGVEGKGKFTADFVGDLTSESVTIVMKGKLKD